MGPIDLPPEIEPVADLLSKERPEVRKLFRYALVLAMINDEKARVIGTRVDAGQVRGGHAPQVLAALRNALLDLYRAKGWQNISDAVRNYGSKIALAFNLITTCPARL